MDGLLLNILKIHLNKKAVKMKNFTERQLKDAMIELYPRKDQDSTDAYALAFDLLEAKIGGDKLDKFLDAYGL